MGIRIAGIRVQLSTFGCILPACIIVSVLAIVYRKYSGAVAVRDVLSSLRPVVIALITAAGLSMLLTVLFGNQSVSIQNVQWISVVLFVAAFFILRTLK
ncbi:MAG: chromate transporter, partial [Acutalibacteraceae bacterium]